MDAITARTASWIWEIAYDALAPAEADARAWRERFGVASGPAPARATENTTMAVS